jgi:hypothetical protein
MLAGALLAVTQPADLATAQAPAAPSPDVPPWHWAYNALVRDAQAGLLIGYPTSPDELVMNAVMQVYEGFAHARTPEAQSWVERFTYNRPALWPGPLAHATLTSFALRGLAATVAGATATAAFTAQVTTGAGHTTTTPMRVSLRTIDGDWKVDYMTLAGGSALFR